MGVDCHECGNGYYLSYNLPQRKLECLPCPENTYSIGGNFRVDGSYFEWTKENLSKFKNDCIIKLKNKFYYNCSPMTIKNQHSIQSGHALNLELYDYTYVSQLLKTFTLIKPGKLTFVYKKDTEKKNGVVNGIFRFYINYKVEINDADMNNLYKEVSFSLDPGTYSFLWQYVKSVSFSIKEMGLTIESISVTGIDSAATGCKQCKYGSSKIGSDYCDICTKTKYFNETSKTCVDCPAGTYNPSNNNCVPVPLCTKEDYKLIYSNKCNSRTHKTHVKYELVNSFCKEEAPRKDEELNCNDCLPGQYMKKKDDYFQCEYCPLNTYSEGNNFLNCKMCDDTPIKVTYYYPDNGHYFENKNIETIDEGHFMLFYELINTNKTGSIETVIDSVFSRSILTENLKIILSKGNHSIKITATNANLKLIKVSHTATGGGYKCNICNYNDKVGDQEKCKQCPPGYEFFHTKQCLKCRDNFYKQTTSNTDECKQCPILTKSNINNTNCEPYEVANQQTHMLKVDTGILKEFQNKLCSMTGSICYKDFYGGLRDNQHNMYFISYFSANTFSSLDLSYKFKSSQSKMPSFIYMLQKDNSTDKLQDNTKIAYSLGNEIDYIKFVRGESSRGLIAHYINGEVCNENPGKYYESYLFLNCSKQTENSLSFQTPRYVNKVDCEYYFEWSSKEACPICLASEVSVLEIPCKNYSRQRYYYEGPKCIISNTTNKMGDNVTYTNERLIINHDDINIIKEFKINDILKDTDNTQDQKQEYAMAHHVTEECFFISNIDKSTLYILLLIPIAYMIIVIICIIICVKYRKIKGNYHILVEVNDSKTVIQENQHEIQFGDDPISLRNDHKLSSIEVKIHHDKSEVDG